MGSKHLCEAWPFGRGIMGGDREWLPWCPPRLQPEGVATPGVQATPRSLDSIKDLLLRAFLSLKVYDR